MICIYVCFRQIVTLSFVATKEKRRKLKPMELVFYGLRCFERGVLQAELSHQDRCRLAEEALVRHRSMPTMQEEAQP